jgi:hypothetical protein
MQEQLHPTPKKRKGAEGGDGVGAAEGEEEEEENATELRMEKPPTSVEHTFDADAVGLVHVDSPRPIAERRPGASEFQPLNLSSENPVSKFAFHNATCTATKRTTTARPPPRRTPTSSTSWPKPRRGPPGAR